MVHKKTKSEINKTNACWDSQMASKRPQLKKQKSDFFKLENWDSPWEEIFYFF
jgi:hypothetical protein